MTKFPLLHFGSADRFPDKLLGGMLHASPKPSPRQQAFQKATVQDRFFFFFLRDMKHVYNDPQTVWKSFSMDANQKRLEWWSVYIYTRSFAISISFFWQGIILCFFIITTISSYNQLDLTSGNLWLTGTFVKIQTKNLFIPLKCYFWDDNWEELLCLRTVSLA